MRRVAAAARRHDLFAKAETVVLAVSGGADSVFLLHALASLAPKADLRLHVAHFDHGWRAAAAGDAAFVRALAEQMALPFHTDRAHAPQQTRRGALSPEEAARSARYRFLATVACSVGATAVATGHTRDDQVETVLLALLRGSGLAGLGGMAWRSALPARLAGTNEIKLVRPLLDTSRAAIRAALLSIGRDWREDETNADPRFPRNRLRRDVVPALEAVAPGFRGAVLRSGALAREAGAFIREEAARRAPTLFRAGSGERPHLRARRQELLNLPPALRGETLRWAAAQLQGTTHDLEWEHVQGALETVARGRGGAVAWLSRRLRVRLERGDMVMEIAAGGEGDAGPSGEPAAPGGTFRSEAP